MPGEKRKFKRRRIVAFSPTCKRERELAASHTSSVAGIAAIGVAVNSLTGVTVGEGRGVRVVAEVLAERSVFAPVGEDIGIVVVGVLMGAKVACEDDVEFTATAGVSDDEATGAIVGGMASVGDSGADVGDSDSGVAD
jgi:hypothetical protein